MFADKSEKFSMGARKGKATTAGNRNDVGQHRIAVHQGSDPEPWLWCPNRLQYPSGRVLEWVGEGKCFSVAQHAMHILALSCESISCRTEQTEYIRRRSVNRN